jgi:hypothetical protein
LDWTGHRGRYGWIDFVRQFELERITQMLDESGKESRR